MPAPLSEGGPIIFCHGGLIGQVFEEFDHKSEHHPDDHHRSHPGPRHGGANEGDGQHDAWELCPVGSALSASALTADFEFRLLSLAQPIPLSDLPTLTSSVVTRPYWARAPPQTHSSPA